MEIATKKRIGTALLLSIFGTGLLYMTGNLAYDRYHLPIIPKMILMVVLMFMVCFGLLNIRHIIRTRKG